MSNVVVYVFLLDNITGFNNALNETVIRNTANIHSNVTTILRKCNHAITDQILSAVSRELDVEVVPMFRRCNKYLSSSLNDIFNESSKKEVYNALLKTTLPELNKKEEFFKKPPQFFNTDADLIYRRNYSAVHKINVTERFINTEQTVQVKNITTKMEYPKNAPFLVAIFETLSNITAQTCAGTLIAPCWVLTAANCLNILSNLYDNNTNMTNPMSSYTVVAGAINPLSDGTTHNVTTVLQYAQNGSNSSRNYRSVHLEIGPYLAMMKIEPEIEGAGLSMVKEKVKKSDVMIYGWILVKNVSGAETLNLMALSAVILSSAECQAMYSYNDNDVICLFNNDIMKNITQFSSGGPVLMLQGGEVKMLAVVQTDERVFIAYPLYIHYNWIRNILNNIN